MTWFPPHAQPPTKGRAKTHTIKDSATLIFVRPTQYCLFPLEYIMEIIFENKLRACLSDFKPQFSPTATLKNRQ